MRKSSLAVPLTILTVIAATACDDEGTQHCVDKNGVVVDDSHCAGVSAHPMLDGTGHPVNSDSGFMWYFVGRSFSQGQTVSGGSYTPSDSSHYSSPSGHFSTESISHGGFGGSFHGGGGGESAGG